MEGIVRHDAALTWSMHSKASPRRPTLKAGLF